MRLAINLATRNRPELVLETIEKTLGHIIRPDTHFVVSVDDDDQPTIDALSDYMRRDAGVHVSVRPREDSLGGKYNRVLDIYPDDDVYLVMVDYAPFITPGFDQKIIEAASVFPDGIGVVFNWMANLSFPQINAVTNRLTKLMGYLYPEYFPYWFIDHWLDDIAHLIDRISFADVFVDVGKRPGTMDMRDPGMWATLFDGCVLERRDLAFKIIDQMDEPEWRKELLKRRSPIVEHHSFIINQQVRFAVHSGQMRGIVGEEPERYTRLRKAAQQKFITELKPAIEAESVDGKFIPFMQLAA